MKHPMRIGSKWQVAASPFPWRSADGRSLAQCLADKLEAALAAGELAESKTEAERCIKAGSFAGLVLNAPRVDGFRASPQLYYRSFLVTEPALCAWLGQLDIDASTPRRLHQALLELVEAGHLERMTERRSLALIGVVGFFHFRASLLRANSAEADELAAPPATPRVPFPLLKIVR